MSTVDFSDFDRSIEDLFQSLESLKGDPDEASKKIDAFLKKNQKFLADHKKNPFIERQLDSLAGRVKQIFPESQKVQKWADYLQTISKSPMKILELKEFSAEIEDLKKSISDTRRSKMGPGLRARLKAFAQNPRAQDFLAAHRTNPMIGRQLLELGISLKRFTDDPEALELAQGLIERAKNMQLPDELIIDALKFISPDLGGHKNVPEEWEHLSLDAKIEWINLNDGNIKLLGFETFDDQFLSFLKDHGSKLRCLRINQPYFDMSRMTTESLNQMLQYCPHLEVLLLQLPPENKDLQISTLPRKLKVLDLEGDITSLPPLPYTLVAFGLKKSSIKELPAFPATVKMISLEALQCKELPPLPKSTVFIKLVNLVIKELPPLPTGLVGLSLLSLNLKKLPHLEEGLEFLILEFVRLDERFNIPTSLKLVNWQFVKTPDSFDVADFGRELLKTCQIHTGYNQSEANRREVRFFHLYGLYTQQRIV